MDIKTRLKIMAESKPMIIFTEKISVLNVKRKNDKINTFYVTVFPKELKNFLGVTDNEIYFYTGTDGHVYITSNAPAEPHKKIKIKQTNQISIPKSFFNPEDFNVAEFILDLCKKDKYRDNRLGILKMMLK